MEIALFSLQINDGDGDGEWSQNLAGGGVDVWWLSGGGSRFDLLVGTSLGRRTEIVFSVFHF
jgi:predicted secreted protein